MDKNQREKAFLLFFSVVFLIYVLIHLPLYFQAKALIHGNEWLEKYFLPLFLILSSAYFIGRMGKKVFPEFLSRFFIHIGSFWLGAILYFYLLMLAVFILKSFLYYIDNQLYQSLKNDEAMLLMISVGIVAVTLLAGYLNARFLNIQEYEIKIDKKPQGLDCLTIAVASDIHAGQINGKDFLSRMVKKINCLHPDLVLIAGDLVDEDVDVVEKRNMGEVFREISAPWGIFAISGNHEYIGNAQRAFNYFEQYGIRFLRDENILLQNSIYLTGREDRDKFRFTGEKRMEAEALANGLDKNLPLIILDHQPADIQAIEKAGFDVCISGHTHHGQLWPLNLITKSVFLISRGYRKIGKTHFIVSNGAGTWGPPVRIGNRPEILKITLRFN